MPAFCSVLLLSQAAVADETSADQTAAGNAIQVETGTVTEVGQFDLSGASTLVVPRSAKITREERSDVLISARKQLAFDGQPPRSILMTHWRSYLGLMSCRDGDRVYLFPYGEWDAAAPGGKKIRKRAGAGPKTGGQGASVRLRLSVPTILQVVTNSVPPEKGACSAKYPSRFDDQSLTESYWFTNTAPPPKWTRVELTEGRPGKKKAGGQQE